MSHVRALEFSPGTYPRGRSSVTARQELRLRSSQNCTPWRNTKAPGGLWDFPLCKDEKVRHLNKLFSHEIERNKEIDSELRDTIMMLELRNVELSQRLHEKNIDLERVEEEKKNFQQQCDRLQEDLTRMQLDYDESRAECERLRHEVPGIGLDASSEGVHEEKGRLEIRVSALATENQTLRDTLKQLHQQQLRQQAVKAVPTPQSRRAPPAGLFDDDAGHVGEAWSVHYRAAEEVQQGTLDNFLSLAESDHAEEDFSLGTRPITPVASREPDARSPPLYVGVGGKSSFAELTQKWQANDQDVAAFASTSSNQRPGSRGCLHALAKMGRHRAASVGNLQ